ncbi:MAG: phosphate acyltransferase [bacterium]|nr:phosphate acyltransferase [bacterium]
MQRIESYSDIVSHASAIAAEGRKKTVVVAAAQDADVIDAVVQAESDGFLNGILVGDRDKIVQLAEQQNLNLDKMQLVHETDVMKAANLAVRFASEGKADAIMKGFLPTSALLKTILDKQYKLRGKKTISHCAVLDIPGYHKLINFTDGGMVVDPDKNQKLGIMENAILVSQALGLSPAKVAIAAPTNMIGDKLPRAVIDIEQLIPEARKRFPDIEIDGPFPLDLALHRESAKHRHLDSKVAGDADVYLFDSIEACNISAKALINFGDTVFAGLIVGAKVPISLVSRTDTSRNKKASLAIACILADYYQQSKIWEG